MAVINAKPWFLQDPEEVKKMYDWRYVRQVVEAQQMKKEDPTIYQGLYAKYEQDNTLM